MSITPQVSVIINNYNYGRFLPRAIDSALDQTGVAAEIIVVDDGSTDDSRAILRGYGDAIRPVLQANAGQAAALNAGVAAARAPLLAFLDADDWWYRDKLARVCFAFEKAPKAGLAYHRLQPMDSGERPAFAPIPRTLCSGDLAPRLLRSGGRWPFPMTSSLTVRRGVWDDAGDIPAGFRISADAWIAGILPFLAPVVALAEPLGAYRIHQNAWYRASDDHAMLARRHAHWAETVAVTNRVLAARGLPGRLRIEDHFAASVAAARLGLDGAPGPAALALRGLRDRGEPNLLRRARDTVAALSDLRRDRLAARGELHAS
ncbi:glycosyltransferase family 2 protein [Roseivivax isoporae]|uniref:Glycosyl transferase n=1 Tax=Roseivivax isoporae LMG 25204 TaxID=1449351 RepID=X7F9H2_9RHOB|nr:glycosyltransferase family 2 protein [Roseivivax isoporae]ETX28739.1 glycosyl transferase [Roseivivax isoporae LMG 25204]